MYRESQQNMIPKLILNKTIKHETKKEKLSNKVAEINGEIDALKQKVDGLQRLIDELDT